MNQKPILYGPDNPHPLSRLKTELVWEGKYDEYGNRRPLHLPATPLPLQRIETIDEPHDREKALQPRLFDESAFHQKAHRDDFRNMLIWGDNKLAMASLLEQFRGRIDLIYIDPPFDVGADFSIQVQIGDEDELLEKEQSILETVVLHNPRFCVVCTPKNWGSPRMKPRNTYSFADWLSFTLLGLASLLSVVQA